MSRIDAPRHLISRKIIGAGWSLTPEQAADSGFDLRSLGAAQT